MASEGILLSVYKKVHRTKVDRKNLDWKAAEQGSDGLFFIWRLPMIQPLVQAWQETQDNKYAKAAVDYINSYLKAFPEMQKKPNALDLGIRNANLAKHLHILAQTSVADQAFLDRHGS